MKKEWEEAKVEEQNEQAQEVRVWEEEYGEGKCFNCGGLDHFACDCTEPKFQIIIIIIFCLSLILVMQIWMKMFGMRKQVTLGKTK